jgi:hypothetical protein
MKWVVWFLLGLGLLFGGGTYFAFTLSRNLVEHGKSAEGTVTQLIYGAKGASYPVVRFQTASGETYEEKGRIGSNPPEFKVNDKIKIFYNESNPKDWTPDSWLSLYFLPTLMGFFSAGLLIAGTITGIVSGRRAKGSNYISYSQRRL